LNIQITNKSITLSQHATDKALKAMGNITIKDIAKALGNSVSTVSKALNDSSEISSLTKQKIIEYAEANNYKPNRLATSLKNGRSNAIGVVICYINNTFVSQLLDGIQKASLKTGFDVIVMQSFENAENEKSCLDALVLRGVDGILIAPVSESSNAAYLSFIMENHCPIVLFDRISSELKTTKVGINEYKGAVKATQHLVKINRKRIVFITGDKFEQNNPRILGFLKALKILDVAFNPEYMITCDLADTASLDKKISESIRQLRKLNPKPNAIFGATDVITTRTLGILAKLKIKVPEEIAVIGFSNTDIAFALNPPLSVIRQPATDMGFLAFTKLVAIIKGTTENKDATFLLDTAMHLSNSTKIYNVSHK